MAEQIELRLDDLMIEELELIEEHAGLDALNAAMSGRLSFKALAVLIWIARRREEPALTLEEVRRTKLSALPQLRIVGGDEPNPTGSAA